MIHKNQKKQINFYPQKKFKYGKVGSGRKMFYLIPAKRSEGVKRATGDCDDDCSLDWQSSGIFNTSAAAALTDFHHWQTPHRQTATTDYRRRSAGASRGGSKEDSASSGGGGRCVGSAPCEQ